MSIQLIAQHRLKAYYLTHTPNNRRETRKLLYSSSRKKKIMHVKFSELICNHLISFAISSGKYEGKFNDTVACINLTYFPPARQQKLPLMLYHNVEVSHLYSSIIIIIALLVNMSMTDQYHSLGGKKM